MQDPPPLNPNIQRVRTWSPEQPSVRTFAHPASRLEKYCANPLFFRVVVLTPFSNPLSIVGLPIDHPEMSRAPISRLVEQGADGFECDLRLTNKRRQSHSLLARCNDEAGLLIAIRETTTYASKSSVAYPVLTLEEPRNRLRISERPCP
jgi:hypothetical protein